MRKKKKPDPKKSEKYRESPDVNNNLEKPIFSFEHMRYQRKYCLTRCDKDEKADIIKHIVQVSQFIWQDIEGKDRKTVGYEKIPKSFVSTIPPPGLI